MRIAVLALQGAFIEHEQMLARLGVESFEIREANDWNGHKDGLIIPGGESTVMGKLLNDLKLHDSIRADIESGLPVFGTCAGLILLSARIRKKATEAPTDLPGALGTMNIDTCRNAYGRQLGSFFTSEECKGAGEIPMTFIRAPYIVEAGEGVEVLARVNGKIVAARQGCQLATAFHPELNNDTSIHRMFLNLVGQAMA